MQTKPHLDCLKKGAAFWNRWREENPEIIPDLSETRIDEIDLFGVNLRNSNLEKVDFTQTTNFQNAKIGGANLAGAKLPEQYLKHDSLSPIESAIKYTQRIFVVMVLGCIYTWLTVATTSDAGLITNSVSSPLPIIGTTIQIAGFYFVAPIVLICIYGYLHIYLQRLWERLAELPARFADGQPLDRKIAPWLPVGLLYMHFINLSKSAPPLSKLQAWVSIIVVWLLLPAFTLPIIWLGYFPQHFWLLTLLHVLLITVTAWFGTYSYLLAQATLRNRPKSLSQFMVWPGCAAACVLLVFCVLSFGGFRAVHQHFTIMLEKRVGQISSDNIPKQFETLGFFQKSILRIFAFVGYSPFPNVTDGQVSIKPSNWTGGNLDAVIAARLTKRYLRYANAAGAFLVKAELGEADFERANLVGADLRAAKLNAAKLSGAYLMQSNLQNAVLIGADLRRAYLMETKLNNANLFNVDAEQARLNGALLQGADLKQAILQCADFSAANMGWVELYDYRWMSSKGRTVSIIWLAGANFAGADLSGTRLEGARLTNTIGLTQEQLDRACVNDRTLLPPGLRRPNQCQTPAERFIPESARKNKYSTFAIGSLEETSRRLVTLLRNFGNLMDSQQQELSESKASSTDSATTSQAAAQLTEKQIAAYNRQFKDTTITLRKEMLSRIAEDEAKSDISVLYAFPTNSLGVKKVAEGSGEISQ